MLILSGAFGRDYKSVKAIKADLDAGKDFVIRTLGQPGYANKEDLAGQSVQVRYQQDRKVTIIKL
jgi:hypothetical protein